jgi:two-component system nitrate/nitrite response regulator NarL
MDSESGEDVNGDGLTRREREVLRLVDAGLTNKAIAARLDVSTATIKTHVHNVLEKLGASRRGEAAALVRESRPLVDRSLSPSPLSAESAPV